MQVDARIIIQGFVQGVGFRFFVHRHATKLGLVGFTRNLYNGDVEIEVEGDRSLVEELIKELKVGPRSAHITNVKIEWKEPEHKFTGFEIY